MSRFSIVLMLVLAAPLCAQGSDSAPAVVPPNQSPPPGMCRIWIDGVPAGRQPAPTDCATAIRRRPPNARVIFGQELRGVKANRGKPGAVPVQKLDTDRGTQAESQFVTPRGVNPRVVKPTEVKPPVVKSGDVKPPERRPAPAVQRHDAPPVPHREPPHAPRRVSPPPPPHPQKPRIPH